MELENCYFCGEFGVDVDRRIKNLPEKLAVGDWTEQGLYHYAGSVKYIYDFRWNTSRKLSPDSRIYLRMKDFYGTCATVRLGMTDYEIPWKAAGMVDITEALQEGENHMEIEIYSSLRNLFGPFHVAGEKPTVINDKVFRTSGEHFTPEYKVEPYGIWKAPVLVESYQQK